MKVKGRIKELIEPLVSDDTIVVVGMAGQFAGCNGLNQFWDTIVQGKSRLTETQRWKRADGMRYVGGFIVDYAAFDAGFFKIPPNEAKCMDPQQRLLILLPFNRHQEEEQSV